MELDKFLMKYLDDNYVIKHNMVHDNIDDINLLPTELQTKLMKIFGLSKDVTYVTLSYWLWVNGMKDIEANWKSYKRIGINCDDTIENGNTTVVYFENATIDLDYNYELIEEE